MIYQVTVDDIDRTKQWQWAVFVQALAGQGALFAVFSTMGERAEALPVRLGFTCLATLLTGLATYYVFQTAASLETFRARLARCRDALPHADRMLGPAGATRPQVHVALVAVLVFTTVLFGLLMVVTPSAG